MSYIFILLFAIVVHGGVVPTPKNLAVLTKFDAGTSRMFLYLNEVIPQFNYRGNAQHWQVRVNRVPELPSGALTEIVPVIEEKGLVLQINVTPRGAENPAALLEEIAHLNLITGGTSYQHPYLWVETLENARRGSLRAQARLARADVEAVKLAQHFLPGLPKTSLGPAEASIIDYCALRFQETTEAYAAIDKHAVKAEREALKAQKLMGTVYTNLEAQKVKFNELVAANDRAGVRKMIQAYLPWELMEPSEKHAWESWLAAIEAPDLGNRELVFRGMDDDLIIKTTSEKPGLLSTVLTKNQGSYTRRLRSLTTLRERFGAKKAVVNIPGFEKVKNPPSLLTMMSNHAGEPVGSPFLSVSNLGTASNFGVRRRAALLIDKRRLVPNPMAFKYVHEEERLVPLVIFPDEVVYYVDVKDHLATPGATLNNLHFQTEVEKRVGRTLTYEEVTKRTDPRFLQRGLERAKNLLFEVPTAEVPGPCRDLAGLLKLLK